MAFTVLENVSQDELNWYHESRYWMAVSDEKTRIRAATESGISKGIKQKTIDATKKLYSSGVSIDVIAASLDITPERVKKIVKNIKQD